jgi:hypothetical protein
MAGAQAAQAQVQQMMQALNQFSGCQEALSEIMGGPASKSETLSGIIQKWEKKIENFDTRGFQK